METLSTVLSTTSMLYTLSLLLAFMVLFQLTIRKLVPYIPQRIQDYSIISKFQTQFHNNPLSEMTLIIDEYSKNHTLNEVFEASHIYLQHKISPLNHRLKISKSPGEKNLSITVNKGEQIIDVFLGINLKWVMIGNPRRKEEMKKNSYELSFLKIHKQLVLNSYLPYVIQIAESMKEANRVVKLQSLGGGPSAPINLNHPSTFDTLAMDPALKKSIMDDLDRFLDREHYYRRVGKAWKRGYLLYGPPGTGKSSLIAAMANYLKFHIYDLELTGIYSNISLRNLLVSTKNRSIIVIEDIDCTIPVHNRKSKNYSYDNSTEVTLSGLLNFIDGLWSSCGDERIIVFTTNYKERLDPALLRPGRMDMHIHMSYLTPSGFRVLARNYLGVESGPLIQEIEELISELEITPAEVAEELMKYDDDDDLDASLESLIQVLENKKFIDEGFSEGIDESF